MNEEVIGFLTIIKQNRMAIVDLTNRIFERTKALYEGRFALKGAGEAASEEDVEKTLLDVHEANIQLALAEIDILKAKISE